VNSTLTDLTDWLVKPVDYLLGWLLFLPRDLSLLLFAAGTALFMTLVRRFVTNQSLLKDCATDLQTLRVQIREAKQTSDKQGVARKRATVGLIKGMQLAADFRVLAVVLVPVAILAVWASERFDYLPLRVTDEIVVRAHFPVSSNHQLTHLVPIDGLLLQTSSIQVVEPQGKLPPQGTAEWKLKAEAPGEYDISIRHRGETVVHRVNVGGTTYWAPVREYSGERFLKTDVAHRQYLPLGRSLGSDWIKLPPWMLGYLLLTLLLTPAWKRLLRVA
jgi:uncharacterized membrane protein (DUF106 family)